MPLLPLTPRHFYGFALLISAGTLAAVLIMEYGFGLKPCELCTFQRVPYAAALLLAAVALSAAHPRHGLMLGLLALLFTVSMGLGIYHAGVEKNIFPGPTACTSSPAPAGMTPEEFKARIMSAPVVACNEPQWQWHGITLAVLNVFWSSALSGFYFYGFLRSRRR